MMLFLREKHTPCRGILLNPMSSQFTTPSMEQEIHVLLTSMVQLRISNYVTLSALMFMLYDIIINLEKEILLVWDYRQNHDLAGPPSSCRRVKQVLVHVLFIFSRYYGLVFLACVWLLLLVNNTTGLSVMVTSPESSCKRYYYYLILAGTVIYMTIVNVILAMRINALYKANQGCGVLLGSLVDFSVCAVVAVRSTGEVVSAPSRIPWLGCMMNSHVTPALTLASWLTALLVSTIFCVMTVKNILFDNLPRQDRSSWFPYPRTRVLLYDGVTCYFLVTAIVLVSTVVLTVVQNEYSVLPASRLILNIRAVEHEFCPADVPDDPESLPPIPCLTLREPQEQPTASSSRV
ncbi:hypothetical protein V8E55_005064 [Tylopilus felleus]